MFSRSYKAQLKHTENGPTIVIPAYVLPVSVFIFMLTGTSYLLLWFFLFRYSDLGLCFPDRSCLRWHALTSGFARILWRCSVRTTQYHSWCATARSWSTTWTQTPSETSSWCLKTCGRKNGTTNPSHMLALGQTWRLWMFNCSYVFQ